MPNVLDAKSPYFPHDLSTRTKRKIRLLIEDFGFEGYGLFWAVVEYMHENILKIGEERLIEGKKHEETIKRILNDYDLFYIENDCYVSDRIKRNIEEIEEKSSKAKSAVSTRWLLSDYKKYYTEIFDCEPVIEDKEIETLKKYEKKIKDFKTKLPDILYTLSKIKFDTDIKFNARSNWLLKEGNLGKVVNGEFGDLLSFKAYKEALKKQQAEKQEQTFNPETISTKVDAIEYILKTTSSLEYIAPPNKALMKRFDITLKELEAQRG